jgi:hypothetical protein
VAAFAVLQLRASNLRLERIVTHNNAQAALANAMLGSINGLAGVELSHESGVAAV